MSPNIPKQLSKNTYVCIVYTSRGKEMWTHNNDIFLKGRAELFVTRLQDNAAIIIQKLLFIVECARLP